MTDDRVIFAKLAEAGSFAAAARQLGLARSTVMRRLDALEAELELRLVQRAGRNIILTEIGRRYAEALRPVLRKLGNIEQELRSDASSVAGDLRVWAPILGTSTYLAPALGAFARAYPAIVVRVDFGRDTRKLELGEFDIALQIGLRHNSELNARTVMRDRLILVASREYLEERGHPRSLDDLAGHRAIYIRDVEGKLLAWRRSDGTRVEMPPASIEVNAFGFGFQLARSGAGIVCTPSLLAADKLAEGELVHVLPELWAEEPMNFVYLPDPSPAARAFLEFMSSWFADAKYPG